MMVDEPTQSCLISFCLFGFVKVNLNEINICLNININVYLSASVAKWLCT